MTLRIPFLALVVAYTTISIANAEKAAASTFVGNGGDAADFELLGAQNDLRRVLEAVEKQGPADWCSCSQRNPNTMCGVLSTLTSKQKAFCTAALKASRSQLLKLLPGDGDTPAEELKLKIRLELKSGPLFVRLKDGTRRPVDAIAQPSADKGGQILIDRDAYLSRPREARLALLAHEYLHFVDFPKSDRWPSGKWNDEGEAGPFTGFMGQRAALDAMGAALSALTWELRTGHSAGRSKVLTRGWTRHLLSLGVLTSEGLDDEYEKILLKHQAASATLQYAYDFNLIGLGLSFTSLDLNDGVHSVIRPKLEQTITRLSLFRRFFPLSFIDSRLSQLHLKPELGLAYVASTWTVQDNKTKRQSKADGIAADALLMLEVPLFFDFWLGFGGGAAHQWIDHTALGAALSATSTQITWRLSYGF